MYQNQHGAPPPAGYPPAYSAYYPQQYDPNYQHSYYQYQQPPPPPFPPPPPPTSGSTIEHQPVPPPNPPQPPPPPPSEPPPPGTTEDVTPHRPPEPTEEDKKTEDMKIEGTNGSGDGPAQHEDEAQRTPSDGGQTPTEENQWQAAVSQWMGQQAAASQWAGQQATSPQWAGQQTPSSQWVGQQTPSSQWAGQQTPSSQWAGQHNTSQWAGYPSHWQATPQWPEQQWRGQQWVGQQTAPQWAGQQAAPQWAGQQAAPHWVGQQATQSQWAGQQATQSQWVEQQATQSQWAEQQATQSQWVEQQATQSQWAEQQATQSQWAEQQSSSQQTPGQASAEPQQTSGWQAQQATSTAKQQPADSQGQQDSSWQQGEQDSQQQQQQPSSTAWQVPQQPKEGGGSGGASWQGQQSGWQPSQPDAHSWQTGKDGSVWQGSQQDTATWQAWQGAQGAAWQSHLAWQSAQLEQNATWQSSQSQSQQWPTSQSQQNTGWSTAQAQYSSAQPPQQGTTWQDSQPPQPQQAGGGGGSSNYSWGGQWPQWGGEGWQANNSAQQWQKPSVEAWAGQPWGQQGGEGGGGKQRSYNYQQTSREAGPADTSYQAPGVGYNAPNVEERQQHPSHRQPSPQQPSPQQRGGYNPLPSHHHREHDVPRYESGRGERTALLPTPPAPSPSDAPVDHKRLSYDDSGRGRKRKRPSRWESRKEERVLPSADYRHYNAVPPPDQMPRLSQQPSLHSGRQEQEEEEDRTPPLSPLPPKQEQKEALDDPTRQWPPQLSSYISRAFDACSTDQERDRIHHFLQVELLEIFNQNKQWSINWDTYPLPLDKGMEDRKSSSRWDTPSPSAETRWLPPELPPQQSPVGRSGDGGMEGGRGKRKRKRKRGKNRFFIDTQPSPDFVVSAEEQRRIDQRAHRFTSGTEGNRAIKKLSINDLIRPASSVNLGEEGEGGWQGCAVEGTSQALEKQYLRLTAAPDPSTVRPEHVLQLSLDHVWTKWTANQDYHYVCEQLKSIRQDLTVQGIRNEFTVRVYETHGRVALENGDRGEFNQCQTQLKALYSEGCHGNHAEFLAYRILYLILTNNTADMSTVLLEVPSELRHTPCVDHALKMRSAWALGNYHSFFRLYHSTPNVGVCLLNMFVERERTAALKAMAKAYRPTLAVSFISAELGFASDEECLSFLVDAGAVLDRESTKLDCKLTSSKLSSSG